MNATAQTDHRLDTEGLIGPDLVLLLLAAPSSNADTADRINSILRLEKLLFLISEQCVADTVIAEPFKFVAYHYGPYSRAVYDAVGVLEAAGLLTIEKVFAESVMDLAEDLLYSDTTPEISYERQLVLTNEGKAIAMYLTQTHPKLQNGITQIKQRYGRLTLSELVHQVYAEHPDYFTRTGQPQTSKTTSSA